MHPLVVVAVFLALILAALPLALSPPTGRTASWLRAELGSVSESTVVATRAAFQRIGFLSATTLVAGIMVVTVGDFDLHLGMVAYALALVVGAAVPLGGSDRRRADLMVEGEKPSAAQPLSRTAFGLSVLTGLLSVVLLIVLKVQTPEARGAGLDSAFFFASIDSRQLTAVALVSIVLSVLSVAGLAIVARRQSVAGVSAEADRLLRRLCSRRITYGLLGGQALLLSTLLPALQIFALGVPESGEGYATVSSSLIAATSVIGLLVMAAGIILCALAVLIPVWQQSGTHQRPAGDEPDAETFSACSHSNADSDVDPRPKD